MSWTADIKVGRRFFKKAPPTSVIVKTLAPPEAIICRIEYPAPFTDREKAKR